jgi:hypothetical protein
MVNALRDAGVNADQVNYLNAHSGNLRRALLSYNGSLGTRSSFPDRVMRIYRDLQRVTTAS